MPKLILAILVGLIAATAVQAGPYDIVPEEDIVFKPVPEK